MPSGRGGEGEAEAEGAAGGGLELALGDAVSDAVSVVDEEGVPDPDTVPLQRAQPRTTIAHSTYCNAHKQCIHWHTSNNRNGNNCIS